MKVAVYEAEPWERDVFQDRLGARHELAFSPDPLDERAPLVAPDAEALSSFVFSELGRPALERFPRLRLIATRSTGYDHIDLAFCRERNIAVANVPSYGSHTVAEHTFALLLVIAHRMVEAVDRTRRGDFSLAGLQGFDLRGKTLAVIGTGEIGSCVAAIAHGFGMKVLGFDPSPSPALVRDLGVRYGELEEVLGRADIVSLHVPLNAKTVNMISADQFRAMKKGVVLINTARGGVIDSRALLQALADGTVAAAGLDVLPEEPAIREEAELLSTFFSRSHDLETVLADHILLRMRNVVITPHSAFNTREAVRRIIETTCDNLEAFARGRPVNLVGIPLAG